MQNNTCGRKKKTAVRIVLLRLLAAAFVCSAAGVAAEQTAETEYVALNRAVSPAAQTELPQEAIPAEQSTPQKDDSPVSPSFSYTVTADAPEQIEIKSQDTQIITQEEIAAMHVSTVVEALQKKSGSGVKRYGAYGSASTVYIRGFSGGCVAILVDGVQVNSTQTGEFDLSRINIDEVERIEIVRGASDSKYTVSGAAGGIINIVTRKENPETVSLYFNAENTSYNTASLFDTQTFSAGAGFAFNRSRWNISGMYTGAENAFPYTSYNGTVKTRKDADARTGTMSAAGVIDMVSDMRLSVTGSWFHGDVLCPGTMTSAITGRQKDTFVSFAALLDVPYAGSDKIETQLQTSYKFDQTDYTENTADASFGSSLHNLHTAAAVNRWTFSVYDNSSLSAAADFSYNYLDSTDSGAQREVSAGLSVSADIAIGKKIMVYPSCKIVYGAAGFVPVPKAGITWTVLPESESSRNSFSVSANIYRMFAAPVLNQLYWKENAYAKGNATLDNEDGIGGDVVFSCKRRDTGAMTLSVFTTYYRNKIQWAVDSDRKWTPLNTGSAAYFGGSISVQTDRTRLLSFGGTYNMTLTYLLTDGLSISDNRRIMYTPVHTASCFVQLQVRDFSLMCTGTYTGKRFISNLNKAFLEPYFLLDLSAEYRIKKYAAVYVCVKNLLNQQYTEIEDYPLPGCSVTAGVKTSLKR